MKKVRIVFSVLMFLLSFIFSEIIELHRVSVKDSRVSFIQRQLLLGILEWFSIG